MEITEAWHYESPEGTTGEDARIVGWSPSTVSKQCMARAGEVDYPSLWRLEDQVSQVLVTELHTLDFGFL